MRFIFRRPSTNPGGYTAVAVFLLTTLALAAWLAYQAFDAAAAERRTAESVLRDYAGIAAAELARFSRARFDFVLGQIFEDAPRRAGREGDPWSGENVRRYMGNTMGWESCACPTFRSPLAVFRIEPPGVVIESETEHLSLAARNEILRLTMVRDSTAGRTYRGFATAPAGTVMEDPVGVGFMTVHHMDGRLEGGVGFVVAIDGVRELFEAWYARRRLLPQPIAPDQPNDSILHVRIDDPWGKVIFASPMAYPTELASVNSIGTQFGNLTVLAAIRPDAAEQLIIGGLPGSRIPLLAMLLLLTLGVGIAAVVQLRREQRFQELREDFVSGVSHELRTPLAQIRIFSELQEAGRLTSDDDRVRAAAVIHRESRRLSHLVENILQFSSSRRRPMQHLPREEVNLSEALADGIDAAGPILADRGMKLDVNVDPDLRIVANRDAMTRILVNLLDNAAKYGPDGQEIALRAERSGNAARISVSDRGPGVLRQDRERVWKPYRRLDRDVQAKIPGTGIGLSVVADLVEHHGGKRWIEDAPGGGARFVIELPLAASSIHRSKRREEVFA